MALWQKVQKLDSNQVKEIIQVYSSKNIPIELRDICAVWIEGSFKQSSAEKFCTGLRKQLQQKLQTLANSSSSSSPNNLKLPFYVIEKLVIFQGTLSTCNAAVLLDIYNRFKECLESEKFLIDQTLTKSQPKPMSSINTVNPNSTASNNVVTTKSANFSSSKNKGIFPTTTQASFSSSAQKAPANATEIQDSEKFLSNPIKLAIDGEITCILGAVWVLEESSNNFSIKCHEIKRLRERRDQLQQQTVPDSRGQPQSFHIYSQLQETQSNISQIRSEILQTVIQIHGKIVEVANRSILVMQNWNQLKAGLDMDLSSWTIQQKFSATGNPITSSQIMLQTVSEYLLEVAWKLRGFLITTEKVRAAHQSLMEHCAPKTASGPNISEQIFTVTSFIKQLVQDTFVVIHQPCQVLKTNTRFHVLPGKSPMEICLFVGEKLGLQLSPPTVNVCIVDEYTCKNIQANGLHGASFGKIVKRSRLLPDSATLGFCSEKKCSSAIFGQISLKDFHRNAKKGALGKEQELVIEEKFALLFRSEFDVGGIEFKVWRLSLPIVVTTHGSQDSLAWSVVTWDNAFSLANRIPFQLPDYVSWEGVREMFNGWFINLVGTPLTQENLDYFAERLSIYSGFPIMLTWSEVCKNVLPGKEFSLWQWFFEGAKFIEQYLKDAWKDGHVKGFIGKESSENMLRSCLPGTFMLRFSESILGGISIVWLHSDGTAYSLEPFKSKDLTSQLIVERLNQETLHYVYPNMKKEDAFRKYYEEYESAKKSNKSAGADYVKFKTQVVIDNPCIPRFSFSESNSLDEQRMNRNEVLVPHQQEDSEDSVNTADENETSLFDFDMDKLLSITCEQDSSDASVTSAWHENSSGGGEINDSNFANSPSYLVTDETTNNSNVHYDETIYVKL